MGTDTVALVDKSLPFTSQAVWQELGVKIPVDGQGRATITEAEFCQASSLSGIYEIWAEISF